MAKKSNRELNKKLINKWKGEIANIDICVTTTSREVLRDIYNIVEKTGLTEQASADTPTFYNATYKNTVHEVDECHHKYYWNTIQDDFRQKNSGVTIKPLR